MKESKYEEIVNKIETLLRPHCDADPDFEAVWAFVSNLWSNNEEWAYDALVPDELADGDVTEEIDEEETDHD